MTKWLTVVKVKGEVARGNRMSFRHGNCAIDPKRFHAFLTFWVHVVGGGSRTAPYREPPLHRAHHPPDQILGRSG
jgi:hypothetical protein